MVNVIIYLKKEFKAEELVSFLLSEKLIATASIDENNISYQIHNDRLHKEVYSVITAKTKAVLLNNIIKVVEEKVGADVLINSTPIVGSNKIFDELVKDNTKKN
ncbi:MAG: divalent cation tolerance protein CutA [Oligoflexus sp.]|nr:divalent cation tolerance protein CutA [Pseudopedobacter sp.]